MEVHFYLYDRGPQKKELRFVGIVEVVKEDRLLKVMGED